jgi:glucuronoarabinoxylan endo-1,4-beta-xylanase
VRIWLKKDSQIKPEKVSGGKMAGKYRVILCVTGILFCGQLLYGDANVLLNPDFESGISEWAARGGSISAVTTPVHGGSQSGRAYNRTATWHGIQQNMLNKMVAGQTYQISGWVQVENVASATVLLTVQKTDGSGTAYTNVKSVTATNTGWVQLSGSYPLTVSGTLTELLVYFECSTATASFFVDDASVYGPVPGAVTTTSQIDPGVRHQVIEGFGGAGGWYEGWLTSNTQKNAIYDLLFTDLGLDIYRVRNTYSYDTTYMSNTSAIVTAAKQRNPNLKILISCWSPPASLKSNGTTGGGGTLIGGPASYNYQGLATWWADSITGWAGYGVNADYISIQNEPDFTADWDSCRYEPSETTTYAGYNQAFEAVYNEMFSRFGTSMPKMLASEITGFDGASGKTPSDYLNAIINQSHVYGYSHHLYNPNAGDTPDTYLTRMQSFNTSWGTKPLFQTEYEKATDVWPDALNLAHLLHNSLTVEEVTSYIYWDPFWTNGGLISLPSSGASTYTVMNAYWGFKHFTAFTNPGWQRVDASSVSSQLRTSAYISPDNSQMSVMFVNPGYSDVQTTISFANVVVLSGQIYRTTQTENCILAGSFVNGTPLTVPQRSVITLSLAVNTAATPPAFPTGLFAIPGNQTVVLDWNDNSESDLAGYNVYRSETSGTNYVKLNSSLLTASTYIDNSVTNSIRYYYVVTAVDGSGNESSYSVEKSAMPQNQSYILLSSADFESGFGDWVNITATDTHDWTRYNVATPSSSTGPNTGALGSTWYVYLETSTVSTLGNTAILQGPVISGTSISLEFYYHMYGSNMGTLNVDVYDGVWHNGIWSRTGPQHATSAVEYTQAIVNLSAYTSPLQIRFRAVAAGGTKGDMAIDNIKVYRPFLTCQDVQNLGYRLAADLDGNCQVEMADLVLVVNQWLSGSPAAVSPNYSPDIVVNSNINLGDFAKMSEQWMECNTPGGTGCIQNW